MNEKGQKINKISIFITGASSGLGKALAESYAAPDKCLFLCGRNKERLYETAANCKEKGAEVYTYLFDVTDAFAVQEAILNADGVHPIDLLIANAGISGGVLGEPEGGAQTRQIFNTNVFGVVNSVLPTLERMRKRKSGQVVVISSIAGYRGLPYAPAYSASKSCVKAWGEALRGWLKDENIKVNVVCPGFIKTPLTDANAFKMPFLMQPTRAAKIIIKGIAKNKPIIAFPLPMAFGAWLMSALPACIIHPILRHLPKK